MDSKHMGVDPSEAGTAPPSYSEALSHPNAPASSYYSALLNSQLSNLSTQITAITTQQRLLADAQDEHLLSLLTTCIQSFLSAFGQSGFRKGTLFLIPAQGLSDEKAVLADSDDHDPTEFIRVERVRDKESTGELWWWTDEDMARRLAGCLRPKRGPAKTSELPPRPVLNQGSSGGSRFWGRKKSVETSATLATVPGERSGEKEPGGNKPEDDITMEIRPEEVTFRFENGFGMYEAESGWAVVLRLRVALAKK